MGDNLYAKTDEENNMSDKTDENVDEGVDGEDGEQNDQTEEEGELLADKLADKFFNRVLKSSVLPQVDMETTTLGKSSQQHMLAAGLAAAAPLAAATLAGSSGIAKFRRRLNDELADVTEETLANYSDEQLESMLGYAGEGGTARQLILKAMTAMKGMKAMKVAKAMKARRAMKTSKKMKSMKKISVSKIAKARMAKSLVFADTKVKTFGGPSKAGLIQDKNGKIRSKKQQAWTAAVVKARRALGLKGFVAIKKGTPLYEKTKSFYR